MKMQETITKEITEVEEDQVLNRHLILHNDDVHTFDYVIDALMDVCKHQLEQATQCTYLVHYKGKCDVKTGHFSELKKMKDALINRELNATID
ncbi:ATP-dependent Clp protease adaptor ClpS [Prolixibacteraceae bacterium JC049]|nr:ATP-dependent Clp protease adaptor ClpS [Prolixibacteraceae bacterium JC049]